MTIARVVTLLIAIVGCLTGYLLIGGIAFAAYFFICIATYGDLNDQT